MAGKLNVYNLGKMGVNVDKDQTHLEDGELTKAQNAVRDPLGVDGGLRKRAGLVKVNAIAAAGSITGMVPVPIAKPSTRRFIFGRYTDATTSGWNTSTDGWTTSPTTGGPDTFDSTNAVPRAPTKVWTSLADVSGRQFPFAGRAGVVYRNRFFYAGNDYVVGTSAPTIHVWDGTTDYVLCHIPDNPDVAGATSFAVLCMIAANQRIYLTTYDGGLYSANTVKVRIFELNPENGALVQLGSRFPISPDAARVPYGLAWHMGRLWTATYTGGIAATSKTYYLRPGIDTDWTLDNTSAAGNSTANNLISFQGQLYIACLNDAGSAPFVRVRSTLGAYTSSVTAALNEGGSVPVMPDFGSYGHFGAMAVFGGNLYVSYFNFTAGGVRYARVYKYTGSAWSVVYFPAADAASAVPYHGAFVHNSVLYMWSSPAYNGAGTEVNRLIYTTDGTTWTEVGSILDNFSAASFGLIVT